MKHIAIAIFFLAGAAHAEVFKCPGPNGTTVYSDAPCGNGVQVNPQQLRANSLPAQRPAAARTQAGAFDASTAQPVTPSDCPTAQDVKNLETSASSITLSSIDKQVKQEDVRRAKACQPPLSGDELAAFRASIRPKHTPPPSPTPSIITSCDSGGCWDNVGQRYNSGGGSTFVRQDGRVCQRAGNQLECH